MARMVIGSARVGSGIQRMVVTGGTITLRIDNINIIACIVARANQDTRLTSLFATVSACTTLPRSTQDENVQTTCRGHSGTSGPSKRPEGSAGDRMDSWFGPVGGRSARGSPSAGAGADQ